MRRSRYVLVAAAIVAAAAGGAGAATTLHTYYLHSGDRAQVDALDVDCRYVGGGDPQMLLCFRRSTENDCKLTGNVISGVCGAPTVAISARYIYVMLKNESIRNPAYKVLRTP